MTDDGVAAADPREVVSGLLSEINLRDLTSNTVVVDMLSAIGVGTQQMLIMILEGSALVKQIEEHYKEVRQPIQSILPLTLIENWKQKRNESKLQSAPAVVLQNKQSTSAATGGPFSEMLNDSSSQSQPPIDTSSRGTGRKGKFQRTHNDW